MSLIDCPECQQRISDRAYECPQCGNPMNERPNGGRLLSEKNIGQITGAAGIWLTAPWLARLVVALAVVIAVATVIVLRG
ncbi:TPA: zinc ribbon domain-containing protein [Pseudomonas aeruginosa]|nr:zinc ribbon domain-containing protein [Pseudomonas aeruginosa]HEK0163013.1 zinc ribbon domain-containing protein [Pseudomonas aeruginosa]